MARKTTIYIFGNPLLPLDSLPIKYLPKLKKDFPDIHFEAQDPNENLKPINKKLIIIDTVINIKKIEIFNDLETIETQKIYSAHDFDLAFNLKLLQKIGKLEKVVIFGVPAGIDKKEGYIQLKKAIENHDKRIQNKHK